MELHEFMCPEPALAGNARLRRDPDLLTRYPSQLAMLADVETGTAHVKTPSGHMVQVPLAEAERPGIYPDERGARSVRLLRHLRGRVRSAFAANMHDASPFDPELYLGFPANILQHNRQRGNRQAVLWRLDNYWEPSHRLGGIEQGPLKDPLRFREKLPRLFWRGSPHGLRWTTQTRTETLGGSWGRGDWRTDPDRLAARFSRVAAVLFARRQPERADCRFSARPGDPRLDASHPDSDWFRPFAPPEEQLRYRYLLCPAGLDVSSQLYWVLQTNSVALKEEAGYECVPDYFLKPWVHYVPIAPGLSDLDQKLHWCRNHRHAIEAIIERAQEAHRRILDADAWRRAENTVLERLGIAA